MMHVRARRHNTMELIGHVCILYMQQIYHDFETTRTEKKVKSKQCPQLRKSKCVLPKMLARSRLVGKNNPGPIWGHFKTIFPWAGKM